MSKSKFLCSTIILVSIVTFNLITLTLAQRVFQQDILVTTFEDELNNIRANDTCSLREAIILINDRDDEKFGGCEYSSNLNDITNEPDVGLIPRKRIVLKEGTYELTRRTQNDYRW